MRPILALALFLPVPAVADHAHPIVVELYTAQGCSACPAADQLLEQLADDPAVLPLALHVDYWDYIGWADTFASPAYTARQEAYARAVGEPMIYTPQIIIDGRDRYIGTHADAIVAGIAEHRPESPIALHAAREGQSIRIFAACDAPIAPVEVHLVTYRPYSRITVTAGENAGRELHYANVVTGWVTLGTWDGSSALDLVAPAPAAVPDGDEAAILLQEPGPGPILAAVRVD